MIDLLMDLSQSNYLQQIALAAEKKLKKKYSFSETHFSSFQLINAFLFQCFNDSDGINLLITLPTKRQIRSVVDVAILIPVLKCFLHNLTFAKSVNIGDVIIKANCGSMSSIKAINDEYLQVLPTLTTKRTVLSIANPFLILNPKVKAKIREIEGRATLTQKQKGLENIKSKLLAELQEYLTITDYFINTNISPPTKHITKIVIVASKEILTSIPPCIPFRYINKGGEINPDASFDPILYVVNDFTTAKEFIIDKGIEIDTIIFIGDNKYKTTTAITRLYRQEKFHHCIFIGTEDIESTDKFKIRKWNWTLPETRTFFNEKYAQINAIKISQPQLSEFILDYVKIVENIEKRNEHLINVKKSLRFVRKIYTTTALNGVRIENRADEILIEFEKAVKELFQDEYQSIDKDYKPDFEILKNKFKDIISLVKINNKKAEWFKSETQAVDYIVVPKVIKSVWEKEIIHCLQSQLIPAKAHFSTNMQNIQAKEEPLISYKGLKSTSVITLREFEEIKPDSKRYLFLSFYGYGVYPETLLELIYSKNVAADILLYDDEYKAYQYHLFKFYERTIKELRAADREELIGVRYSEPPNISTESIDEWVKFLIDAESFRFSKKEEIRYEITFWEDSKKIKERESKTVYVEDYEHHHKEICELKNGDRVRIYQNPEIEILHDIIKMTDERELFSRVDKFSILWKSCLKNYLNSKVTTYNLGNLFEELVANGLSVSKNQLENWLQQDNKTKFPKRKIDFSAIVKTVNNDELNANWKFMMETSKEYLGTLNHKGRKFADEIENYIITEEKGEMLSWLSDKHIERIITIGAPLRTVKDIKKLDYEITD